MSRRNGGIAWYRWFPGDWAGSRRVRAMTLAERGLYRELLDLQSDVGPFKMDPAALARQIGCDSTEVAALWPAIQDCFEERDGRWSNPKIQIEIDRAQAVSNAARRAVEARSWRPVKRSIEPFVQSDDQTTDQSDDTLSDRSTPTPTPTPNSDSEDTPPAANAADPPRGQQRGGWTTKAGFRTRALALEGGGDDFRPVWERWVEHLACHPAKERPSESTVRQQYKKLAKAGAEVAAAAIDWLIDQDKVTVSSRVLEVAESKLGGDERMDDATRRIKEEMGLL